MEGLISRPGESAYVTGGDRSLSLKATVVNGLYSSVVGQSDLTHYLLVR